ncbi:hypothetical protein ACFYT4_34380 [Streptomyces sp. NPDC004609]
MGWLARRPGKSRGDILDPVHARDGGPKPETVTDSLTTGEDSAATT